MNHDSYSDDYIADILRLRARLRLRRRQRQHEPAELLRDEVSARQGLRVIPVNPGLAGQKILGQQVYATLADVPGPVDVVDIFRNSDAALAITREAIALKDKLGLKVLWMQLGVRNDEAAREAEAAGLKVVMNRCPKIEYGRLSGEIGWAGVNSGRSRACARSSPRTACRASASASAKIGEPRLVIPEAGAS